MPLAVERYELGPIRANCYVVRADRSVREAVVIDPGGDIAAFRLELARIGASCAAILVTHADVDHIGGVADLAEGTGAPVFAPPPERFPEQRRELANLIGHVRDYAVDTELEGGEMIEVAGISFEVLATPGHSPDHVAFSADGCLFAGDLLFAGSVGRVDLPGGDWDALLDSVRAVADRFPPETVVYSGHGPPTTLGAELALNPFLAELRA
jgi:glyoxylase-like metal-dependent hydrolase (beta-lactamase superfamily II)